MAAKPHKLQNAWHTYMGGTRRLLHHVSLTMLQASVTELQTMLSFSENPRWLPDCMTYMVPDTLACGDHKATSPPCMFDHAAGKCYWVMDQLSFSENPRWLPNCDLCKKNHIFTFNQQKTNNKYYHSNQLFVLKFSPSIVYIFSMHPSVEFKHFWAIYTTGPQLYLLAFLVFCS